MIGTTKLDWAYIWYMIRHKWFVLRAGVVLRVPLWRLLVHDLSKFKADEWGPYRHYFYDKNRAGRGYAELKLIDQEFNKAHGLHLQRNDHHWEYWLVAVEKGDLTIGEISAKQMPERAVREMVADWIGAGRAINRRYTFLKWYEVNEHKIILHPATRARVLDLLIDFEDFLIKRHIDYDC